MIVWRRLGEPGLEVCRFAARSLAGIAVFGERGRVLGLEYRVEWDSQGRTRRAWVGGDRARRIASDGRGRWRFRGRPCRAVDGCEDVDLWFSPATNTLPLRRLKLGIGERAEVRAAWLSPEFELRPLLQEYSRVGPTTYRYRCGRFRATLEVDRAGIVVRYGKRWERA